MALAIPVFDVKTLGPQQLAGERCVICNLPLLRDDVPAVRVRETLEVCLWHIRFTQLVPSDMIAI